MGDFEVDELIATGRRAFVFGGRQRATGAAIALKVLRSPTSDDAAARERLVREATALVGLAHPGLVPVLATGDDPGLSTAIIAMGRAAGQPATAVVKSGPLPWPRAASLIARLGDAIAAAHARGVVDGQVVLDKVWLGERDAWLCGFGITDGSPLASDRAAADVYGVGAIAFELLTGRPPLEGASATGMLSADPVRIREQFPALDLPEPFDELLRRCRMLDPRQRPAIAEVAQQLHALAGEPAVQIAVAAVSPSVSAAWTSSSLAQMSEPRRSVATPVAGVRSVAGARSFATPAAGVPVAVSAMAHSSGTRTPLPGTPIASDDPLAPPEMIGSYRVMSMLGSGGNGHVYLGQHPVIGSKVAIKVLLPEIARSPEIVERFMQEARASSQIASSHIPKFFDFGTTANGLPFAIMEYIDGETLGDRLARVGPMPIEDVAQVIEQVASALAMAHDIGLIHRDLKPDNLLLVRHDTKSGRTTPRRAMSVGPAGEIIDVKVLDFGIAKMLSGTSGTQTQSGFFLGTPFYCAPEQVFGGAVDGRTDVYSLGATAFEMLTGAPPFAGEIPIVLSSKVTREPPSVRVLREVSPAVAETIDRMLARDPDHRAPSMEWVLEEVARWPERAVPERVSARAISTAISAPIAAAPSGPIALAASGAVSMAAPTSSLADVPTSLALPTDSPFAAASDEELAAHASGALREMSASAEMRAAAASGALPVVATPPAGMPVVATPSAGLPVVASSAGIPVFATPPAGMPVASSPHGAVQDTPFAGTLLGMAPVPRRRNEITGPVAGVAVPASGPRVAPQSAPNVAPVSLPDAASTAAALRAAQPKRPRWIVVAIAGVVVAAAAIAVVLATSRSHPPSATTSPAVEPVAKPASPEPAKPSAPTNPNNAHSPDSANPTHIASPSNPSNPVNAANPTNPSNPVNAANPTNPSSPVNAANPTNDKAADPGGASNRDHAASATPDHAADNAAGAPTPAAGAPKHGRTKPTDKRKAEPNEVLIVDPFARK